MFFGVLKQPENSRISLETPRRALARWWTIPVPWWRENGEVVVEATEISNTGK